MALDGVRGWLTGLMQRRGLATLGGSGMQPWNRIVWPNPGEAGLPSVYDAITAYRLPGVARAIQVYEGMLKQMPLDSIKGDIPTEPRPRLLESPDPRPEWPRSRFVAAQVQDYLFNGNAVSLVTQRDTEGWPLAAVHIPSGWVEIEQTGLSYPDDVRYWVGGQQLNRRDVIHIPRGCDPLMPCRGVGVVEQHLATLERIAIEEDYGRRALKDGAVPSIAIITPNPRLGEAEAEAANAKWMEKFRSRKPAFLPSGTQVVPLSWSPSDAQLTEVRKLSLVDIANIFNLDPYWLGAPAASMTYQSPGPMYVNLLRVSLEPVLADFEGVWSQQLVPRGQVIRFQRTVLTRDDFATTITTLIAATSGDKPLMTRDEARAYLGWAPFPDSDTGVSGDDVAA